MAASSLPAVPPLRAVIERLPIIFPEGIDHRNYCIRDMAARTIWVMFYAGAVQGQDRWVRPSMVVDMGDRQAGALDNMQRESWYKIANSPRKKRPSDAWYAPNSREPVRDETIRAGLIPTGAVIERPGLPTTSGAGRYALAADFAALFDPALKGTALRKVIAAWQGVHLSRVALARITLLKKGAVRGTGTILVTYPNGHTRSLAPGPGAVISKAVIEEFGPRYLSEPAVLWLSESASKVREQDNDLAKSLRLSIDPARELPDIILVDLNAPDGVFIVFIEVVATDGPISERRKASLMKIAQDGGFNLEHLAFVTAFADRGAAAYKKCVSSLAWDSFAWFASEPDRLVILRNGAPRPIHELRR